MQPSLFGWMFSCAAALAVAGCHAPWSNAPSFSRSGPLPQTAASADPSHAPSVATLEKPQVADRVDSASSRDEPAAIKPELSASRAEPDMRSVLAQLEQVGDVDQAAQQRLISELRRTKPELWPLVTQQFRSSLMFRQQLQDKHARQDLADDEAATTRPSAEIGGLVDPRGLRRNPLSKKELIAESATMDVASDKPPAEFKTPEATTPIEDVNQARMEFNAAQHTTPDEVRSPTQAVLQASFENAKAVGAETPTVVTPSLESPMEPSRSEAINSVATGPDDWKHLIDQAAANLARTVASSPQSTAEVHQHVSLRMLKLLGGQTEEALEPIPGIAPMEQDYWSRQLFALATYLDHHKQPDDHRRAAASATHLDEAVAKLRELGSLSLRNLTFCKTVYDFGAYEPFPDNEFSPGEPVSIYVEVENYRSLSTEKGYRTVLGGTYEIVDAADQRVAGGEFPDVEDICRSRRRDFHIEYGLALPAKLEAGTYRMRLVVKDRQSDKLGSADLTFDVSTGR